MTSAIRAVADLASCKYRPPVGWIIETVIDWIWTDTILAVQRRYGWMAAVGTLVAPFILIGLFIALLAAAI